MKIYMAPLEGVTGYVFRNAFEEYYGKGRIDKYFIPFISPNKSKGYTTREQADIAPEHNAGINVVPQIMANDEGLFLEAAAMLKELGYSEINLNLGCPSGTVVSKYRGAGFLAKQRELDIFLDKVLSSPQMKDMRMSVKTRTGMESHEEFKLLMAIYGDYPLSEIIIHPRVRTDYYKNSPDMDIFRWAVGESSVPISYNGDIFRIKDYVKLVEEFPDIDSVMIGRGFVGNQRLINQVADLSIDNTDNGQNHDKIRCEQIADNTGSELIHNKVDFTHDDLLGEHDMATLEKFTGRLLRDYISIMDSEVNAMHKMKEVWIYINQFNPGHEKAFKKIKKSRNLTDYQNGVREFFDGRQI